MPFLVAESEHLFSELKQLSDVYRICTMRLDRRDGDDNNVIYVLYYLLHISSSAGRLNCELVANSCTNLPSNSCIWSCAVWQRNKLTDKRRKTKRLNSFVKVMLQFWHYSVPDLQAIWSKPSLDPTRSSVKSSSAQFKVNTINATSSSIQAGSQKWIHALKTPENAGVLSQRQRSGRTVKKDNLKTGSDTGIMLSGTTQAGIGDQTTGRTTTTTLLPALCKMFDSVKLILICPEIFE